jgi:hypothetical protein
VVVAAMEVFCRAWASVYDVVFYCPDRFGARQGGDPFRAKVLDLQDATDQALRDACTGTGVSLVELPRGLTVDERVDHVMATVESLGLLPIG